MTTDLFESELRELLAQQASLVPPIAVTAVAARDYQPRAHRSFVAPAAASALTLAVTLALVLAETSGPSGTTAGGPTVSRALHAVGSMTYLDYLVDHNAEIGSDGSCSVPKDLGSGVVETLPGGLVKQQFPPITNAGALGTGVDRTYYVTAGAPHLAYLPAHDADTNTLEYVVRPFDGNVDHIWGGACATS